MNGRIETALVIGATSDIGCAIARALAEDGRALQLAARDPARLEREARDLRVRAGAAVSSTPTSRTRPRSSPRCWRAGADVAYGLRAERDGETRFKRWTAGAFYRLLDRLADIPVPLDTGDFRLMDRAVVDGFLSMPERDRFMRGMVAWAGFRQEPVPYRRAARAAGETKYLFWGRVRLAIDGIMSFSLAPLRLATWLGLLVSGLACAGIVYVVVLRLFTAAWVSGWASLLVAVLFLGGVQLLCLGILGAYLGRIYGEVKRRPLYLVKERLGFPAAGRPAARDAPADE